MCNSCISTIIAALLVTALGTGQEAADKKAGKQHKPRFTISKETTYVTEPLDAAGYVDYEITLNERLRGSTTAANNANVLLWRAWGPSEDRDVGASARFFHRMGMASPPKDADYFVGIAEYLTKRLKIDLNDAIFDDFDRAGQRPWKAKEHVHFSAWLKLNERQIALVTEASKRSHYFAPVVKKKGEQSPQELFNGVQKCREVAQALSVRAMLHVGEGRLEAAWQDLLTLHRLARLMTKGGTLVEQLVGIVMDSIASSGDLVLLDHKEVDANRLKNAMRELKKLPLMAPTADKFDLYLRLEHLELLAMIDRRGFQVLDRSFNCPRPGKIPDKAKEYVENVDWDPAFRLTNSWYDRLAAALRQKNRETRVKQLDSIDKEVDKLKARSVDSGELEKVLAGEKQVSASTRGQLIGVALISVQLCRSVAKMQEAMDRAEQIQRNLHLAVALGIYKREQGSYPKKLEALVPKYLDTLPEDLFTGKPLVYRLEGEGYLLYSFGANGKDDQGRWYDDVPMGDDPRVRMPLAKP